MYRAVVYKSDRSDAIGYTEVVAISLKQLAPAINDYLKRNNDNALNKNNYRRSIKMKIIDPKDNVLYTFDI